MAQGKMSCLVKIARAPGLETVCRGIQPASRQLSRQGIQTLATDSQTESLQSSGDDGVLQQYFATNRKDRGRRLHRARKVEQGREVDIGSRCLSAPPLLLFLTTNVCSPW